MKKTLFSILLFITCLANSSNFAFAEHLTGGEMKYQYISSLPGNKQIYAIVITIYRDALGYGADFDNPLYLTRYDMDNYSIKNTEVYLDRINVSTLPLNDLGSCARNIPNVRIEKAIYTTYDTVSINNYGYVYAHQRCCRPSNITNLYNPGEQGSTYSVYLTRPAMLAKNSNAEFLQDPPLLVCIQSNFEYQFSATDKNSHQLKYYLCEPTIGGNNYDNDGIRPVTASSPPYSSVHYGNNYSSLQPFGQKVDVVLDSNSGILRFRPDRVGIYTVAVCIEELDSQNKSLGFTKRDIQFNVANCITASASAYIEANQPSEGVFATCRGREVSFKNNSTDAKTFYWDFGVKGLSNDTSTLKEPIYTYPDSGTYQVSLIINKGETCADTANITINIYPTLTPNFDFNILCENKPVSFKSTSTSTIDPIVKYTWLNKKDTLSQSQNVAHTFSGKGPFPIQLLVETKKGCQDTITKMVTLPAFSPSNFDIVGIQANAQDIYVVCNTQSKISFKNNASNNIPAIWKIDNKQFTDHSIDYTFSNIGDYYVQLILNPNTSCADTSSKWIKVTPLPSPSFTSPPICLHTPQILQNTSSISQGTINSYSWNIPNVGTFSNISPTFTFITAGTYNVTLKATSDMGCTASITQPIEVLKPSIVDFDYSNICYKAPVYFEDKTISPYADIKKWTWTFDNSTIKNGKNTSYTFSSPDTHTVKLLVESSNGCKDSIIKQIDISPAPIADFILDGDDLGNHKFVKCDDTYKINFSNTSLYNTSNSWIFDKYGTTKEVSPSFTFPDTGHYFVQLIINEGSICSDSQKIQIDVLPDIKPDFSYSTACEKNEIQLKNISQSTLNDIVSSNWTFDNQDKKSGNLASYIFNNDGQHTIMLKIQSQRGCIDSIQKSIDVFPLPIVDFDFPEACLNQSMKINNTSKGVGASQIQSYYWILNNTTSIEQYPFVTYDSPGVFPIKLKATTVEGCKDSISKDVLVRDIVVPIIDPSKLSSCQYDWVIFDGTHSTGNYQYYSWDFGNGQVSNSGKDSVQYLAGGDYHISLMLTDKLCGEFTSESEFKITTAPVIDIGDDFALCPLLTKPISLSSDILNLDSVVWNSGENNIWEIIANGNSGTVIVETYYKECHISDTLQIIPKCDINAPQAFSPNGDGQNDYFNLIPDNVQSFELSLFNRWGQLIFQTNNLSQSWDGTFQGLGQPMDNYTYYARGINIDGTEFAIQGVVLLVR
ncbi:MAG: PKD domain-containing protein [Chitinophagales bacterium]|nr:PKD domain-containing protein [Chitinophagales bacterium]MCZ2393972.1 PKD domain-containing protein [Chitinophagales bacterium]